MKILELVGRPGTGKTTLAHKICDRSGRMISRETFFKRELSRGRLFRWLPDIVTASPYLADYITNKSGELLSGNLKDDPVLLEAISLILGDVTSYDRLQPRLNLLFRDYAIHTLAQQCKSDEILLLDEGLTHRVGTFTLNGLTAPTLEKVAELLPTSDLYAYIGVSDETTRRRLIGREKQDSLYIPEDIYQSLRSGLIQRNARFVNLSELDELEKKVRLILSASAAASG